MSCVPLSLAGFQTSIIGRFWVSTEVFAGDHQNRRARQRRYIALGETCDGRLALVVFRRLPEGVIRVMTARDMEANEQRLFRRK